MAIKDIVNTKKCLFICNGGSCMKKDAEDVTQSIRKSIKNFRLNDEYHTIRTKCMGRCDDAPVAMMAPDSVWLKNISPHQCSHIINEIQLGNISNGEHFMYKMK